MNYLYKSCCLNASMSLQSLALTRITGTTSQLKIHKNFSRFHLVLKSGTRCVILENK